MKDFILLFRLNKDSIAQPSPELVKERMAWLEDLAQKSLLADRGNTLSPIGAKTIDAEKNVVDMPHSEGKEIVTGYLIVKAETIDEAVAIAKTNFIFKIGGSVEVRETVKLIVKGND